MLRDVDAIGSLSPLLACDVAAILADADRLSPTSDREQMQYVCVRNVVELTSYVADPEHPDEPMQWLDDEEAAEQDRLDFGVASLTGERVPLRIVDATGDDSVSGAPRLTRMRAPELHGRWTPPYHIRREFGGWGKWEEPYDGYFRAHPECDPNHFEGAFALDFTPVAALLHLPLQYVSAVEFRADRTGQLDNVLFATQLTITFGDFVEAIFEEIGFHGSPAARDAALETIRERSASLRADSDGFHDDASSETGRADADRE